MLVFPLKKEWYEKIKSGEKTVEYREIKPYWTKRLQNELGGTSFEPVHYMSDKRSDSLSLCCVFTSWLYKKILDGVYKCN